MDESIRNLKELSGKVDAVIKKRTQEMQEKDDELANFCAEVQRLLMCDTSERYLKKLQTIPYKIATSIQKENWQMPKEVVDAISRQLYLRGYKPLTKWCSPNSMRSGQILTLQTH